MGRFRDVMTDIRPLRVAPAFRRLWIGQTISGFGQQIAIIAVAFEVYALTKDSFFVGLVGLAGLLPLVLGGLYGGALVDAFDRRKVALVSAFGLWACSLAFVAHILVGLKSVGLLYAIVAVQSAFYAVNNPARTAILPQLLPREHLPAANALNMASTNLAFTVGPLLGGVLIAWNGVEAAYMCDAVLFVAALVSVFRLPELPAAKTSGVPGLHSVFEGLRFLRFAPNVRMTFIIDLCAMVFAQPRALFPALAVSVFASGATGLGVLQAAPGMGAVVIFAVSGWISRVNHHGRAVAVSVVIYGACIAAAGAIAAATSVDTAGLMLWCCVAFLAGSGAADMVSAAYRSTILQTAAPDEMRGRMQGVFIVVVAGGPRLGDFLIGSLASLTSEQIAMMLGGLLCMAGVLVSVALQRRFLAYDARTPTP